jgi:uncharacterized protein DUF3147
MDSVFLTKVTISFFVAGVWIATATFLAERFGTKIGGLITNLPSNILVSLIFIAQVNDINFVVNSIPAIPIGMTINSVFIFVYILVLPLGILRSTILSLFIWFLLAFVSIQVNFENLKLNVIIYIVLTLVLFFIADKYLKLPQQQKSDKPYKINQLILRAVFAGGLVAAVVFISNFFDAYIVGIFSSFPAVLLSTMVILAINQNIAFARVTGKILILSTSNIVVYSLVVYFTYPTLGIVWGTVFSFLCAFIWVWVFYPMLNKLR